MVSWLPSISDFNNGEHKIYYPLELAKERFEIRELCEDGYLILCTSIRSEFWLDFAVMQFGYEDDTGIYLVPVFYGAGTTGVLRECRHTYWGDAGYIFYPNGKIITAGLKALEEFFDMD